MPDRRRDIDRKIKESFEGRDLKAPEGLWSEIQNSVEYTPDEVVIKDSFDNLKHTAPESSWNTVRRQLIIDGVWENIVSAQDKRRRRGVFWWLFGSAASVVILTMVFWRDNPGDSGVHKAGHAYTEEASSAKDTNGSAIIEKSSMHETDSGRSGDIQTALSENQEEGLLLFTDNAENDSPTVYSVSEAEFATTEPKPDTNTDGEVVTAEVELNDLIPRMKTLPLDNIDQPQSKKNIVVNEEEAIHNESRRFEFGLIAGIGNTWLFNNDVKNGFNRHSLIRNKFSLGWNIGVSAVWNLKSKSALYVNYDLLSIHRQEYNFFYEGRIIQKDIRLEEKKVTLGYKHSFLSPSIRSYNVLVKGGFFFTHSTDSRIKLNDVEYSGKPFEKINYGLNLSGGMEHVLGRIKVEYGLNSDIGLKNISVDSSTLPKIFNYANTFKLGFYGSVRYLF